MGCDNQITPPGNRQLGRSGMQGNPPPGATVLQPIVEERVREVVKERVEKRYIEVPQVYYVDKLVEVPREVPEEKIVKLVKPVKKEVIKYVKKPVFVDKIVEVPEIKYVDKVVEVPRYAIREKIIDVPNVLVIERIIPVLKSYRKDQIVYVEPGGQAPFNGQCVLQSLQQQRQPQGEYMEAAAKGGMLPPLCRPANDSLVATHPIVHPHGLPQIPPHMLERQTPSYTGGSALRKVSSASPFANLFSQSGELPHLNAMSTDN